MLHVSLRGLGLAVRASIAGAEMLLDAIEEAVGQDGTLLMVLGSAYPLDWVNHRSGRGTRVAARGDTAL